MVAKHCATEPPKPHQTKEDEVRENMKIANAKSTSAGNEHPNTHTSQMCAPPCGRTSSDEECLHTSVLSLSTPDIRNNIVVHASWR